MLGYSYREIRQVLDVSKGSLSNWLSGIPLTAEQAKILRNREWTGAKEAGRQCAQLWQKRRQEVQDAYNPPVHDPAFMLGLGLYWGEGAKAIPCRVGISNMDAAVLRTFMAWARRYFGGEFERFGAQVHHPHGDEHDTVVLAYWSKELSLPLDQFLPCLKVEKRSGKNYGHPGYGVAHIRLRGHGVWRIRQKIDKAMKVAAVM
jgi:hypothetical protein